uniref:1-phosphatidylinositol 4,5-bisphosphate phosphodiesterase delta-1-like n=1 Tax=Epinephelus lanceolatus TaxID=310571 RepID=UPI001446411A|nr:1-phosphatidylinositol 4,5-bisphosphate phosphodiesterase delta-1-like [Epinephelus lanceolatus]
MSCKRGTYVVRGQEGRCLSTTWYPSVHAPDWKCEITFATLLLSSVSLDDISEVQMGRHSEGLKKNTEAQVEGRCFSIMFKGRRKTLDLIASSEEEAKQWVNSLQKMVSRLNNLNTQQKTEHWIFSCLAKADKNQDDKMSKSELKNFLRLINIEVDDEYTEMLFKMAAQSAANRPRSSFGTALHLQLELQRETKSSTLDSSSSSSGQEQSFARAEVSVCGVVSTL